MGIDLKQFLMFDPSYLSVSTNWRPSIMYNDNYIVCAGVKIVTLSDGVMQSWWILILTPPAPVAGPELKALSPGPIIISKIFEHCKIRTERSGNVASSTVRWWLPHVCCLPIYSRYRYPQLEFWSLNDNSYMWISWGHCRWWRHNLHHIQRILIRVWNPFPSMVSSLSTDYLLWSDLIIRHPPLLWRLVTVLL